jgi:ArsR family transcriptional regulator, arsenate/arsenite/antimonite-responsive transcriptional repressor
MAPLGTRDRRLLARRGHALSDETRLEILERLAGGERCVCELVAVVGAAQSRLSFHLKTLKDAGLVTDRPDGRWVYYALNPKAVAETRRLLARLAAPVRHRLPVLDAATAIE